MNSDLANAYDIHRTVSPHELLAPLIPVLIPFVTLGLVGDAATIYAVGIKKSKVTKEIILLTILHILIFCSI